MPVKFRNGPLWSGSTEHRADGTNSTSMDKMLPDPENSSCRRSFLLKKMQVRQGESKGVSSATSCFSFDPTVSLRHISSARWHVFIFSANVVLATRSVKHLNGELIN